MLRRTLSSLASVSSESKPLFDQENELNFDPSLLIPTPSPNRSKYEGKLVKTKYRRPLGEKKVNKNNFDSSAENVKNNSNSNNCKDKDSTEEQEKEQEKNTSFQDLFHLNTSSTSNTSNTKIEELTMALSETLKENEELHDTVSLLKAEIERLNKEILENQEYAELYLLGKELIENQAEEIENLKKKLVKRD